MNSEKKHESQKIKRGLSNLFLASASFKDPKRIESFGSLYSIMQIVDDLADSLVDFPTMPETEKRAILNEIDAWQQRVEFCYASSHDTSRIDLSLLKAVSLFGIPRFLFDNFFYSMKMPISIQGFSTMQQLEDYANGTAIVPVTLFLMIVFSEPDQSGVYTLKNSDELIKAGKSIGLWSYMIHTMSIEKLYLRRNPSRNLLPQDVMARHGVTLNQVKADDASGALSPSVQAMLNDYMTLAMEKGRFGLQVIRKLISQLPPHRMTSVAILISTYRSIQDRIISGRFNIFNERCQWRASDRAELMSRIESCKTSAELIRFI